MEPTNSSRPAAQLVHVVQQLYQVPINPGVLEPVSSVTVVPLSSSDDEPNVTRTVANSKNSSLLSSTALSTQSKAYEKSGSTIVDVAGVNENSSSLRNNDSARCQMEEAGISLSEAKHVRMKDTGSSVLRSSSSVCEKGATEPHLVINEIGEYAPASSIESENELHSSDDCDDMWQLPDDICRICAKRSESIEHVFSDKSEKLGLVGMIHSYLPILVTPEDVLPLTVCRTCISSLQVTDKLVKTCVVANDTLRILVEHVCKVSRPVSSFKNVLLGSDAAANESFPSEKNRSNDDVIEESSCNSSNLCNAPGSPDYKGKKLKSRGQKVTEVTLPMLVNLPEKAKLTQVKEILKKLKVNPTLKNGRKNRNKTFPVTRTLFKSATATCEIRSNCGDVPSVESRNDSASRSSSQTDKTDLFETVVLSQQSDVEVDWDDDNAQGINPLCQLESVDFECISSCKPVEIKEKSATVDENSVEVSTVDASDKKEAALPVKIRKADQLKEKRQLLKLNKSLNCRDCDFVAATKEELGEHKISHLKCKYCGKPHKARINLIEHERVHTKEKPFVCDKCGWRFRTKSQMLQHAQRHNPETPYECKICGKRFSVKTTYTDHVQRHNEESPYLCETCGKSFKLQAALRFHRFSHRTLKCSICDRSFSYRAFQVHKRSHSGEGYICSECGKKFLNREHLKNHMLIHEGTYPFKCGVCHRSFKRITHLQAHRQRHAGDLLLRLKFFICAVCDESFDEAVKLSRHVRNHSKEEKLTTKAFRCSSCDKCFAEEHELHSHELQHNTQLFSCGTCNESFSERVELDKHASDHFEDKPHACDVCGKRFGALMNLSSHKAVHQSEKPYSCELCVKSFKTLNGLNQHKMVHSNVRKFPCPNCELCFKRKDALKNHERTHFTERPYTCSICTRSFKVKSDCTTHLRRHRLSGLDGTVIESLFNCHACPKTFILNVDLANHVHTCHNLEVLEPNLNEDDRTHMSEEAVLSPEASIF